jgi:hypothetical protein
MLYIFYYIYFILYIYILFTFFKNKRHAEIRQRDCTCKKEARSFDNVPVSDKVTSKSATFAHWQLHFFAGFGEKQIAYCAGTVPFQRDAVTL